MSRRYVVNTAPMAGYAPVLPIDPREQAALDELRRRREGKPLPRRGMLARLFSTSTKGTGGQA